MRRDDEWTAEHCLNQLGHMRINVSLGPNNTLVLDVPVDWELTDDCRRVINKYKQGMIEILMNEKSPGHTDPN